MSCAYPRVLDHFKRLMMTPSLPALNLQHWENVPNGVSLGRGLVARGCDKYPGKIQGLVRHLQESLASGLQCLQRISPNREQDALRLFALLYDPPSPIELECVTTSENPTSTVVPDFAAKATVQCQDKYSFSIQMDVSALQQAEVVAGDAYNQELWLHEFQHLLGYSHNKGIDVIFLSQWCCFSKNPEVQSGACNLLQRESKISPAEYLAGIARLLQAAQYNDLALWTPWLNVVHYQKIHPNHEWETPALLQVLADMTSVSAPVVRYHKEDYKKKYPWLFAKESPDSSGSVAASSVSHKVIMLDGEELTEEVVRKKFTQPYFALIVGYAALYANPSAEEHPEWERFLAEHVTDVFFPKTGPFSRHKRILARIMGRLVTAISMQDGARYASIARRAQRDARLACYVLNAREKKQLFSLFNKIDGSFGLLRQWQEDRIDRIEEMADIQTQPMEDPSSGQEPETETIFSLWRNVVDACRSSTPPSMREKGVSKGRVAAIPVGGGKNLVLREEKKPKAL